MCADRTSRNISQNPHVFRSNTAKSNNRCRETPSALAQCQPKSDPTRNTSSRAHDSRRTQEGDMRCQAPAPRLCRVASDARNSRKKRLWPMAQCARRRVLNCATLRRDDATQRCQVFWVVPAQQQQCLAHGDHIRHRVLKTMTLTMINNPSSQPSVHKKRSDSP